jgi:hypothetical protein
MNNQPSKMKNIFALIVACVLAPHAHCGQIPVNYDMTKTIVEFHDKFERTDIVAEMEKIETPSIRFVRMAAKVVELNAMARRFDGHASSPFTFTDKHGIFHMPATTANDLTESDDKTRFLKEKALNDKNLACIVAIGDLNNKLFFMMQKIMIATKGEEATAYKSLYDSLQLR